MNELLNLLPMLPWEGPPLPKFLGITWSSLFQLPQLTSSRKQLSSPKEFVKSITPYTAPISEKPSVFQQVTPNLTPAATYDNGEITEIEWNEDGFPTKIKTHRHAVKQ